MKCGSCRSTSADVYSKIQSDNDLMEILKRLNPNRVYNPKYFYFCNDCVSKAKDEQASSLTTVNSQNAKSFSVVATSTSNASDHSDSSKDEYDVLVSSKIVFSDKGTPLHIPPGRSKRKDDFSNTAKPCPKRFKKPLAPVQLPMISEAPTSSVTQTPNTITKPCPKRFKQKSDASLPETSRTDIAEVNPDENVSSERQQSSESISENGILLSFEESSQSAEEQSRGRQQISTLSSNAPPSKNTIVSSSNTSGTVASKPKTPARHSSKSSDSDVPESNKRRTEEATKSPQQKAIPSRESVNNPKTPVRHSSVSSDSDVPESNKRRTKESTKSPQQKSIPSRESVNNPKTPVRHSSESSDSDIPDPNSQSKTVSTRPPRTIRSFFPLREVLPGPTAPAVKNPRIREPISALSTIRNTFEYFNNTNNTLQVHDFPRLLAG